MCSRDGGCHLESAIYVVPDSMAVTASASLKNERPGEFPKQLVRQCKSKGQCHRRADSVASLRFRPEGGCLVSCLVSLCQT
jgi:hypothetical protein